MKKIKFFTALLVLILMINLFISGCSSNGADVAGTNTEANTDTDKGGTKIKKEIIITICGATLEDGINPVTGKNVEGWNTFARKYLEKVFPDVKITFSSIPWDNANAKMQTLLMSEGTDLFTMGGAFIPEYYKEGLIQSLNPFLEADKEFKYEENFPASFKTHPHCTDYAGEQLLTLPWAVGYRLIIYDKQIFDDWGVEYLSEHPTPEEILEKAAKMTGINPRTGQMNYGLWFAGNSLNMSYVIPISQYFGAVECKGRFDDPGNLEWFFDSDEFIKTMEWIVEACKYVPPAAANGQGSEKFGTQENDIAIAIDVNGVTIMNKYYQTGDESLLERFEPTMHVGTNGGNWTPVDGMGMAAHLKGRDAELAWEILKYMCGSESAKWRYENQGPMPIPNLIGSELYDSKDKYLAKNQQVMQHATHPGYEMNPFYGSTIQPTFASIISRAIAGEKVDVRKELSELQKKAVAWSESKKSEKK